MGVQITPGYSINVVTLDVSSRRGDTCDSLPGNAVTGSDGSPVDLTGASIRMHLRRLRGDRFAAMEFSTADSTITIDDAAGGVFTVVGRIVSISVGTYVYDVEVTLASGSVRTVLTGCWTITPDVTR